MTILVNLPITTALSATRTSPLQFRAPRQMATNVLLWAVFTYGSGGTTADAYVQTSIDGTNWIDVANFHFTTSSGKALFNLYSGTAHTTQLTSFTDGSLTANTSLDGVVGNLWAVKYVTTGTYAGGTILRVDMISNGLTA